MRPFLWMWPGMMPILISSGVISPGQFGPMSLVRLPCILYLVRTMSRTGMPSVMQITRSRSASTASSIAAAAKGGGRGHRGGRGCEGRRPVDHRDVGARLFLRLPDGGEDRDIFVRLAGLLRVDPRDVAGPPVRVFLAHLGVELAGLAGDALGHHPGVLIDEDGH